MTISTTDCRSCLNNLKQTMLHCWASLFRKQIINTTSINQSLRKESIEAKRKKDRGQSARKNDLKLHSAPKDSTW